MKTFRLKIQNLILSVPAKNKLDAARLFRKICLDQGIGLNYVVISKIYKV